MPGGRSVGSTCSACLKLARDSEPDELTVTEQALAAAWVEASQRARTVAMNSLAASPTAWFDVRYVRPDLQMLLRKSPEPAQGSLF